MGGCEPWNLCPGSGSSKVGVAQGCLPCPQVGHDFNFFEAIHHLHDFNYLSFSRASGPLSRDLTFAQFWFLGLFQVTHHLHNIISRQKLSTNSLLLMTIIVVTLMFLQARLQKNRRARPRPTWEKGLLVRFSNWLHRVGHRKGPKADNKFVECTCLLAPWHWSFLLSLLWLKGTYYDKIMIGIVLFLNWTVHNYMQKRTGDVTVTSVSSFQYFCVPILFQFLDFLFLRFLVRPYQYFLELWMSLLLCE